MSRRVRWGYAPGSAPELPYTLGPYEAFAIVMQIDSGEDVRSRAFVSPKSVNATVGRHNRLQRCERRSNVEEEAEFMDSDADGGVNVSWLPPTLVGRARALVLRIVMPSVWTCLYVATHHPELSVHPWWYRSGYSI